MALLRPPDTHAEAALADGQECHWSGALPEDVVRDGGASMNASPPLPLAPVDEAYRERARTNGSRFLDAVDAILPGIAAKRFETEAANQVLGTSIAAMTEAGVFRALTPARWGGLEMEPAAFLEGMVRVGSACSSTGWVGGQLNVHSWQIALMDERMQAEFWADGPDARASSAYAPSGTVECVPGGFRLTGRWSFSSGVDHSAWAIVGGIVKDGPDGVPEARSFVIPSRDFVIDQGSWNVAGLKGTGSKSIMLANAFVPDYRTHRIVDEYNETSPGHVLNPGPLYRVGRFTIFWSTMSCPAIGTLAAALEGFVSDARTRHGALGTGSAVAANPYMHLALVKAIGAVESVRRRLSTTWTHNFDVVCRGEPLSRTDRTRTRYEAADANASCFEAFMALHPFAGAGSVLSSHPAQLFFRDLMGMRNHGTAAREQFASIHAQTLLDIPPPPFDPAELKSLLHHC